MCCAVLFLKWFCGDTYASFDFDDMIEASRWALFWQAGTGKEFITILNGVKKDTQDHYYPHFNSVRQYVSVHSDLHCPPPKPKVYPPPQIQPSIRKVYPRGVYFVALFCVVNEAVGCGNQFAIGISCLIFARLALFARIALSLALIRLSPRNYRYFSVELQQLPR